MTVEFKKKKKNPLFPFIMSDLQWSSNEQECAAFQFLEKLSLIDECVRQEG